MDAATPKPKVRSPSKVKGSKAKSTPGKRPKSAGSKKRRKDKKKPSDEEEPMDEEDEEMVDEDDETDVVFTCPSCGLGAGFSVPSGCPFEPECHGAMYVCRSEDGGGRCGKVCWHSHPDEGLDDAPITFRTAYWCRMCHDEVGRGACQSCAAAGRMQPDPEDKQSLMWEKFGQPVSGPTGAERGTSSG